jgi:ADP-ribosylation factor-like protein 2
MQMCKEELYNLLKEEVSCSFQSYSVITRHSFVKRLAGASLLIFANKQDIENALTQEDISEVAIRSFVQLLGNTDASQFLDLKGITTHQWHVQGCSAMTGENVVTGMDWIVDDIASRLYLFSR